MIRADKVGLEVENEKPFMLILGREPMISHRIVLHFGCGLRKVVVAGQTLELGENESVEAGWPASLYGQGLVKLRREGCGVALEITCLPDPESEDPLPVPVEIPVTPYGKNCGSGSDCENGGAVDDPGSAAPFGDDNAPDLRASWFPGTGNDGISPGAIRWSAPGGAAEAVTLDSLAIPGAPDQFLPVTGLLGPKTHATNGSRLRFHTLTGLFEATSDDDVLTLRFFPAPASTTPVVDWDEDPQETPDFIETDPEEATRTITTKPGASPPSPAMPSMPENTATTTTET